MKQTTRQLPKALILLTATTLLNPVTATEEVSVAPDAFRCIYLRRVDDMQTDPERDALIYEMRGGQRLINRLEGDCNVFEDGWVQYSTQSSTITRVCEAHRVFIYSRFRTNRRLCTLGMFEILAEEDAPEEDAVP